MAYRILILGASYGSLFGTKRLMAGHDVTLVCRQRDGRPHQHGGTEVRLRLKGETAPRFIRSVDLAGRLDARTPEAVDPADHDLVVLAMQEPQYLHHTIRVLLTRIAAARIPVPVVDEHAAAALSEADRRRSTRSAAEAAYSDAACVGSVRSTTRDAVLAGPAGEAPR